ncbi:hypothetical protein SCLCIDRAFT_100442, partial [Scleroderma citrinum Foug A]
FFTQIPHPIHKNSEMKAILSVDFTSIQSFPARLINKPMRRHRLVRTHFHDRT